MSEEIIAVLKRVERISFAGTDCYDGIVDSSGHIRVVKIQEKTAAIIDINGKEAVIWPETLDLGTSVDGDALFVYEPPNEKNIGFIDSFDFDNDYDASYRGNGTFIVRLPKAEADNARTNIHFLDNIKTRVKQISVVKNPSPS